MHRPWSHCHSISSYRIPVPSCDLLRPPAAKPSPMCSFGMQNDVREAAGEFSVPYHCPCSPCYSITSYGLTTPFYKLPLSNVPQCAHFSCKTTYLVSHQLPIQPLLIPLPHHFLWPSNTLLRPLIVQHSSTGPFGIQDNVSEVSGEFPVSHHYPSSPCHPITTYCLTSPFYALLHPSTTSCTQTRPNAPIWHARQHIW